MAYLSVDGITCGYPGCFMLKGVSFDAERGSFTGVIGPNASGKTTLLKAVTGIIPLKEGRVFIGGKDISGLKRPEIAREMAMVSQNYSYEFELSVEDFILLGRTPYRRKWQVLEDPEDVTCAERAMDITGVIHLRERMLDALSGGEFQRVCIARALAQEPKLLLLDEATSHLDIAQSIKVLNILKRLNAEHALSVMIVLHDLNLASEYCDSIILMHNGAVKAKGSPADLIRKEVIEQIYGAYVAVKKNPLTGKPHVFISAAETS